MSAIVAEDSAVRAHRRAEEAERKLEEARELLREAWHRSEHKGSGTCLGCNLWRSQGHSPDCRLAAALVDF